MFGDIFDSMSACADFYRIKVFIIFVKTWESAEEEYTIFYTVLKKVDVYKN